MRRQWRWPPGCSPKALPTAGRPRSEPSPPFTPMASWRPSSRCSTWSSTRRRASRCASSTLETLLRVDARAVAPLLARLAGGRDAVARRAAAQRASPASAGPRALAPGPPRGPAAARRGGPADRAALKDEGALALPALHAALEQAGRPRELEVLADVLAQPGRARLDPRAEPRPAAVVARSPPGGERGVRRRRGQAAPGPGRTWTAASPSSTSASAWRPPAPRRGIVARSGGPGGRQDPRCPRSPACRPGTGPGAPGGPEPSRHRLPRGAPAREPRRFSPPDRRGARRAVGDPHGHAGPEAQGRLGRPWERGCLRASGAPRRSWARSARAAPGAPRSARPAASPARAPGIRRPRG